MPDSGGGGGGMEATWGGAGGGGTGDAAAGPLPCGVLRPPGDILGVGLATKDSDEGGALKFDFGTL